MSSSHPVNFAEAFGYHSEAAAILFAVLYLPLFCFFCFQSFARPTYVHVVMAVFCAIRIAAFVLRSVLVAVAADGEKLGLLIADQVLLGIGYFGLLYSAYTLVLDIEIMLGRPESPNPIIRLAKNRHLFRLVSVIAVALVVVSTSAIKSDGSISSSAKTQRDVGVVIFLVLTAFQALQTLILAKEEIATSHNEKRTNERFGSRHAMSILLLASVLLLVREIFSVATVNNAAKQDAEHFWYPFIALPEILATLCFTAPGLVPRRKELQQQYSQDGLSVV
ncbi:hypothetical protein HYPSUDRAFT_77442 [Hypholoma sublateritium FD-334 SS-4]|uniref:THH1/TOM1/TOM3 domain-containing protein n=1 Tax=Hypholoma sublateritium (strain FD-334 SS-4) TaxID=945553 RepID=A0A0D2L5V2_HYPSF|nr:hypothetical protein HYPSUDRAFT_77442 [Hypholoma sublateritium FD-334 SS-4]